MRAGGPAPSQRCWGSRGLGRRSPGCRRIDGPPQFGLGRCEQAAAFQYIGIGAALRLSHQRLCAGGDVTLGTNLDPAWAKFAADTLRRAYGLSPEPDSIVPSLKPFLAGADLILLNVEGAIGALTRLACPPTGVLPTRDENHDEPDPTLPR